MYLLCTEEWDEEIVWCGAASMGFFRIQMFDTRRGYSQGVGRARKNDRVRSGLPVGKTYSWRFVEDGGRVTLVRSVLS